MKTIRAFSMTFFVLLGLAFAGPSSAQTRETPCNPATPNNAICLQVTAPATHEDGAPVVLPITYRYEQQAGAAWNVLATTSARRFLVSNLAPGTYTFRAFATVNAVDSRASNTVTGTATALPPSPPVPPVIQVVQVVIGLDHAPVYRITQAGKRDARYADACGFVPVGSECRGPVLFSFRGLGFRLVRDQDVKPWNADCTGGAAPCG
jgi:hypothetical protein